MLTEGAPAKPGVRALLAWLRPSPHNEGQVLTSSVSKVGVIYHGSVGDQMTLWQIEQRMPVAESWLQMGKPLQDLVDEADRGVWGFTFLTRESGLRIGRGGSWESYQKPIEQAPGILYIDGRVLTLEAARSSGNPEVRAFAQTLVQEGQTETPSSDDLRIVVTRTEEPRVFTPQDRNMHVRRPWKSPSAQ